MIEIRKHDTDFSKNLFFIIVDYYRLYFKDINS